MLCDAEFQPAGHGVARGNAFDCGQCRGIAANGGAYGDGDAVGLGGIARPLRVVGKALRGFRRVSERAVGTPGVVELREMGRDTRLADAYAERKPGVQGGSPAPHAA